jgi:WD repeat-containing protein 19
MVLQEWTNCPRCKFPAILSSMLKILQDGGCCPMCAETINGNTLKLTPDPSADLKSLLQADEEEEEESEAMR